jgi:DNA polymerase-1
MTPVTMSKTLFVIDAYNLIYRMFYAIPEMTTRSGEYVNAIFWVAKFLKWLADENPDAAMVVTTDVGRSFREEIYTEYKAQRDRMPDNLRSQIEGVFALFTAADIMVLSREWYEADDIIGSIAHRYENNGHQVVIISSDKDLCQFVRDGHVHIYDAMKRKFLKEADVTEKFGVPADQVCDYLAIVWDTSDNIPGISGFGPKKAVDLLSKYETLEGIYDHIDELTAKMREVLIAQKENAFLSQRLATIDTSLVLETLPETPFAPGLALDAYRDILRGYEFRSLLPAQPPTVAIPEKPVDTINIESTKALAQLQSDIMDHGGPVILSTDAYGKIVIGYKDIIYVIDSKRVECVDFFTLLLGEETNLVGYDLKTDIKRLYSIQNPSRLLGTGDEGQGRLF